MYSCICKNNYFHFVVGKSYDYVICSHLETRILIYIVDDLPAGTPEYSRSLLRQQRVSSSRITQEKFLKNFDNRTQKREEILEMILNDK
jgi:hypothetical protein